MNALSWARLALLATCWCTADNVVNWQNIQEKDLDLNTNGAGNAGTHNGIGNIGGGNNGFNNRGGNNGHNNGIGNDEEQTVRVESEPAAQTASLPHLVADLQPTQTTTTAVTTTTTTLSHPSRHRHQAPPKTQPDQPQAARLARPARPPATPRSPGSVAWKSSKPISNQDDQQSADRGVACQKGVDAVNRVVLDSCCKAYEQYGSVIRVCPRGEVFSIDDCCCVDKRIVDRATCKRK